MPVIVAVAIRYVIMAAVQLGLWTLLEKYGLPLLEKAIEEVMVVFGVSEEDAQAFVANSLFKAFEEVGIFAITLKTKLPIKVAERLGFASKGFNIRKLSPAGAAKLSKIAAVTAAETVATTAEVTKVAEVVATSKGTISTIVSSFYGQIMKFVGVTALVAMTVGNFIDFANWQGAYQKTFEKFFTALGFPPDQPMPKSKAVSAATWTKIYTVVEELNPESIAFPWDGVIKPYSRGNLTDAVDHFAANLALHGMQTTWKNVWALLLPCIKLKSPAGSAIITPQVAAVAVATPIVPQVHVFGGVVSQGVIGSTGTFTPRPDDLIENADELTHAAHNNLAPFIATMGSRMSYDIKIVPSVKTGSGFTQRGTAQRIVSGYNKDGSAKYRTVVNKFAIMDIFVKTDKGTQSKITTIVLGPVDSVKFQAANVDMTTVATTIKQNIIAPAVAVGTTAAPTMVPVVPIPAKGVFMDHNPPLFGTLYKLVGGSRISYNPFPDLYTQIERDQLSQDPGKFAQNEQKLKDRGVITSDITIVPFIADKQPGETQPERGSVSFAEFFGATPSIATPVQQATQAVAQATTLFEYYQAHGQTLPSVEERAKIYEQLALGQASYYTGTAEQNTKLLATLQGNRL